MRIMGTEYVDLVMMVSRQVPQPLLVFQPAAAINLHHGLIGPGSSRNRRTRRIDLAVVKIGIAGEKLPTCFGIHGNAAMACRMSGKRDHEDFRWQALQFPYALEPEPWLAGHDILMPRSAITPLLRTKPAPGQEAALFTRSLCFRLEEMHGSLREIIQGTGMIEIKMGQDDVPHVLGSETETADLGDRCHLRVEINVVQGSEKSGYSAARVADVTGAETGVDQYQAVACLDQEALAGQTRRAQAGCLSIEQVAAIGTLGTAIDMMNAHPMGTPPEPRSFRRALHDLGGMVRFRL